MKKKILSFVLMAILAFTFVVTTAVSAFAAGTSLTVAKVNETSSTVTVAVGISGNRGISALGVNLAYDSTLLSYNEVEGTGVADEAGMAVFGSNDGSSVTIIVEEGYSGDGTKANGNVCLVTFKKLSTVKDGSTANFTASSVSSLTYDANGDEVEIAEGAASASLTKIETTTKKPAEKPAEKPVEKPEKPAATKPVATKPLTTKPNVVSPTLPGVTVPTTVEETTTEEMTTEEFTTEEWTTEYESYSYTAPEQNDADEDDDKSDNTKRIVAGVVVVVCVGAAIVLYLTKKKK